MYFWHIVGTSHPGVAFFAKPKEKPHDLHSNAVIQFDDVVTNIGSSYNPTGMFVCNRPGVYVFFTYILALQGFRIQVEVVKNNRIVANAHAPYMNGENGSGSNMVILNLNHNDIVWVRNIHEFHGTGISWWSTFSGFLLYPSGIWRWILKTSVNWHCICLYFSKFSSSKEIFI